MSKGNGKIKSKSKKQQVDHASPVIRKAKRTDVEKVQCTRTTTTGMQACPSWAKAVDLQAAVKVWNKDADELEGNRKVILDLREQTGTAEALHLGILRNWRSSTKQVLGAASVFCNGSVDLVKSLSLDVATRATLGELVAVVGMTTLPGKLLGDSTVTWPRGLARHGVLVQHATDIANPATYSAPMPWTKTKFTLAGSPSGSIVHFRIAAIDPASKTGQSPWSEWIAATAK